MKNYTKAEIKKLQTRVFSAMTSKGSVQIKAYLKENALIRLKAVDSNISLEDISVVNAHNSHQASVDKIVEIDPYNELFAIEYDNDNN
jgi:hypothetical protein